jgi:hypothetical protein
LLGVPELVDAADPFADHQQAVIVGLDPLAVSDKLTEPVRVEGLGEVKIIQVIFLEEIVEDVFIDLLADPDNHPAFADGIGCVLSVLLGECRLQRQRKQKTI